MQELGPGAGLGVGPPDLFLGSRSWRDLGCFSPSLHNSPMDKFHSALRRAGLEKREGPVCEKGRGLGEDSDRGKGVLK